MSSPLLATATPTDRRGFFKRAGLGVGVLAAASTLQACDSNDDDDDGMDAVTLDFSNDVGVLNYAYALEQLEAAFYAMVVGDAAFSSTFNADEQAIFRDIAKHEAIHAQFLKVAIGTVGNPIRDLQPDFSDVDFADRTSVLATSLTFEDLGVAAYNGAGRFIDSDAYLVVAGKIVSVEARHASVISGLITRNTIAGSGVIDGMGLDRALPPSAVLSAAAPFIQDRIVATNVPA